MRRGIRRTLPSTSLPAACVPTACSGSPGGAGTAGPARELPLETYVDSVHGGGPGEEEREEQLAERVERPEEWVVQYGSRVVAQPGREAEAGPAPEEEPHAPDVASLPGSEEADHRSRSEDVSSEEQQLVEGHRTELEAVKTDAEQGR